MQTNTIPRLPYRFMKLFIFTMCCAMIYLCVVVGEVLAAEPIDPLILVEQRRGEWTYGVQTTYVPFGDEGIVPHSGGSYWFVRRESYLALRNAFSFKPSEEIRFGVAFNSGWLWRRERRSALDSLGHVHVVSEAEPESLAGEVSVQWDANRSSRFRPKLDLAYVVPSDTFSASITGSFIQDPIVLNGNLEARHERGRSTIFAFGVGVAFIANDRITFTMRTGVTIPMDSHNIPGTLIGGGVIYEITPGGVCQIALRSLLDVRAGRTVQSFSMEYTTKFGH